MYNESKINWLRANINGKTSKITTSRTLNDGKVRYLDVLVNNDLEISSMNNINNMMNQTECATLYDSNTIVKFKSKDLKPFIVKSDKYNTDVLFINIGLKGRIVKSMSNDSSVLAYLIAAGELFLVVSMNPKAEHTKFEVVLHDPHAVADTTYTFEKVNGKYTVSSEMVQTDTVVSKPTYKVTRYRPARPTNLIFVNESDANRLNSLLKYPDSHKIVSFIDGDTDDMMAYIEAVKETGYKAATLFVNSENFNGSDDKTYGAEFDMLKNNFKFVNILLTNSKVVRK